MNINDSFKCILTEELSKSDISTAISNFINYATKEIGIEEMVPVELRYKRGDLTTFAYYASGAKIVIAIEGRLKADIIRSVAHEMVHHKQFEEGRLEGDIPDIGGEIEDEANAIAGQLVKKYGYQNKEIFTEEFKPTIDADKVDPDELNVGVEVEKEHDDDIEVRSTIALHHLADDPDYYSKLLKSHLIDEPEAIKLGKKIGLDESIIDETMKGFNDLPKTAGLFYQPLNSGGVELNLYDPTTKHIYGTITASGPGDVNHVHAVAANQGFGPLMYEFAMMQSNINNKRLSMDESGDVRGDAMYVWERFYQRDDINKETLKIEDEDFSFEILDGDAYHYESGEKTERFNNLESEAFGDSLKDIQLGVLAFNTTYTMEPNEQFKTLITRGDNSAKYKEKAQESGEGLWDDMYLNA